VQIDFYHLKDGALAAPLAMLANKTVSSGHKLLIVAKKEDFSEISTQLWCRYPESFLAHGCDEDEGRDHAPVWLTSMPEHNHIQADFVALTSALVPPDLRAFSRIFNLFDGSNDKAVSLARSCWKDWSAIEQAECRYFAQDENANWQRRK